jgi:hypothetical protein
MATNVPRRNNGDAKDGAQVKPHGPNTQSDQRGREHQDNEGHQGGQYGGSNGGNRAKPDDKSRISPEGDQGSD